MTDREEREEHIKRLEAALACEEKQFSGKCSKQTCDDNCALLYDQGNWGEWKETLRYAINSLKIDLKYDLLYEETSGQADKRTTKNDLGVREFEEIVVEYPPEDLCTYPEYKGKPYFGIKYKENEKEIVGYGTYNPEVLSQYLKNYFISTTKDYLGDDAVSRQAVNELVSSQRLDTFSDEGRKWANIKIDVILRGLKELPSVTPQEPKWISVSERLPEENICDDGYHEPSERVLAYMKSGEMHVASYWSRYDYKWLGIITPTTDEVIAWMPLLKPYEPQESEDKE